MGVQSPAASNPPVANARVQMLTRDPCLVQRLRRYTAEFQAKIADMLQLPVVQVVVRPPLMENDPNIGMGFHSFLALADRACVAREAVFSLLQAKNKPDAEAANATMAQPPALVLAPGPAPGLSPFHGPAPAPYFAPAPSPSPVAAEGSYVLLSMTLSGIDFAQLSANATLMADLIASIKSTVASQAGNGIGPEHIKVSLFAGSVVVKAIITPPNGASVGNVISALGSSTLASNVVQGLAALSGIHSVLTGFMAATMPILALGSSAVPAPVPAPPPMAMAVTVGKNRPWIAWWSVTIKPPHDVPAAQRLIEIVNTPHGQLSELLPLTLARVPGLRDPEFVYSKLEESRIPRLRDVAVPLGPRPGGALNEAAAFNVNDLPGLRPGASGVVKDTSYEDAMYALSAIKERAQEAINEELALKVAIHQTGTVVNNAFQAAQDKMLSSNYVPPEIASPAALGGTIESPYGPWPAGGPLIDRYGPPPDGQPATFVETKYKAHPRLRLRARARR